jgi:hypothetical protein
MALLRFTFQFPDKDAPSGMEQTFTRDELLEQRAEIDSKLSPEEVANTGQYWLQHFFKQRKIAFTEGMTKLEEDSQCAILLHWLIWRQSDDPTLPDLQRAAGVYNIEFVFSDSDDGVLIEWQIYEPGEEMPPRYSSFGIMREGNMRSPTRH